MSLETYHVSQVTFAGRRLEEAYQVTLHDADGHEVGMGSLTAANPPKAGEAGELRFVGQRAGERWRICIPQVEIVSHSAVGCEFRRRGPICREPDGTDPATSSPS